MMPLLLLLTVSSVMTGVIWVIQLLVYPNFSMISKKEFGSFHDKHMKKISVIVMPVMLIELGLTVIVTINYFYTNISKLVLMNSLLLAIIWLSTVFIQVPHHKELKRHYSKEFVSILVSFNWLRTIAWTAKTIVIIAIILGLE